MGAKTMSDLEQQVIRKYSSADRREVQKEDKAGTQPRGTQPNFTITELLAQQSGISECDIQ